MSDLFMALDRELRIVFVNRALSELSEGAADRFLGRFPWELWPALEGSEALKHLQEVANTGTSSRFEYLHDPTSSQIEVNVVPAGDFLHAYFRDVTAQRKVEAELESEHDANQRWRALFDQTNICMAASDIKSGRILDANPAFEKLTGYTTDELRAMSFFEYTHPDDRADNKERVEKLLSGESATTTFRKRYVRKDGETVWVQINVSLIRDSKGEPVSFAVITHDINDLVALEEQHRQADEAMRRSEQRLRQILEASTTGVILNDASGKFIYANAPLLRLLGYSPEDLESGRLCWNLVQDPARRASDDRALAQLRECGYCDPFETELVRQDGTHVPVYMGGAFVPDDSGEGLLGTAFVTDLTVLRDAYDELVKLNEDLDSRVKERTSDLELANEEMAAFTYHVSHDLRAPLRAIVATSRMLQQDFAQDLKPEAALLLERQISAANKLGTLIDELLKLTRLSREESRFERLDLSQLAREVVNDLHDENELVDVVVEEGLWAEGDPRLIRLLLGNLISNAFLYSPEGGTVRIGSAETSQGSAFYISDQGIGFDMQYADKLFRPFERLVTETQFPGTGVGLANVARIVSKHGGQVWAESEPGKGATFFFTLR